jgi:hypothetical protein
MPSMHISHPRDYDLREKTALLLFPWVGETALRGRTPREA